MNSDKIVLITGVSREMGLGFETAKQMVEKGYRVLITARDFKKVKELADKINVAAMALDVTDDQSVAELAAEIDKQFGKLDVLINNAGAFYDQGGEPLAADMQFIKDAFDTNLFGAWRMAKAFVPLLKKSESGRVVNVSSGTGSFSDPIWNLSDNQSNVPVYGITKLALNGLTVKLARQLKDSKIKVNSVCPGFTATYPGTEEWGARPVSEGAKSIVWAATIPDNGPSGGFFRDGQPISW
jgi:NAD(P)-dependent dehydrogenase (short-subunit alcohol dehydrogenase family)